ncbi:MAG: family 78 glycoside hydrolase catalytic domain, partial [Halobacteriaceae archaeon]
MSAPPVDLRVDYEAAPENAAPDTPRFSWRRDADAGAQTAYRVLVARDVETLERGVGDCWDSERVTSGESVHVTYDGAPLAPDETYAWTVKVWDGEGETDFAAPETFGTALAEPRDWQGDWIGHQPDPGDSAGFRSDWIPAEEADGEWVQVDLGELAEFEEIEFAPTNAADVLETPDGGAVRGQFGFPLGYRVEVANDPEFDDARTLVTVEDRDDQRGTRTYDVGPVAARYVRITATDMHVVNPIRTSYRKHDIEVGVDEEPFAAFALSALAVRDERGTDLARHQPVRASSAVTDGHYAPEHLVDGTETIHDASTSPLLRTDVTLRDAVASARLHVTGVGYCETYVNGEKVDDAVLDPGWTNYQDRVLTRTHDVTDLLGEGENALGLWLGRGWFTKWGRGSPRAIVHLSVTYADGTTKVLGSDGTWTATESPVVENDIYDGETYDARLAEPGWAEPGFDDSAWDGAAVMDAPGGELEPQRTVPIRVAETLEPDEIREHPDGPIVDFGQNHTGWLELDVTGASRGDEITVRHAEVVDDEGDLETTDLRSADATDRYVASGAEGDGSGMDNTGDDTYEPRFTYHGYRYAQIEGYPGELTADDVTAKVVHTDFDTVGHFDCANEELAQVQHNARWGLRSNSHSVPTDCPQRNERLGWTGDAQLAARSLLYNFDATGFHEKWMRDHDDAQSRAGYLPPVVPPRHRLRVSDPSWTVTRVVVPYYLYLHYGDEQVLEDHYEQMCRYVDYWHGVAEDGVVPAKYGDYGDWLAFENNDGRKGRPFDLFNTAFHYQTTRMVGEVADALGYDADAARYGERADAVADAFLDRFYEGDGRFDPHIQSAYAIALHLDIAPESEVDAILSTLAEKVRTEDDGQLRTGFLGTRALINTLADHGEGDLAYEVVSQPEKPGWVYMVRQGATTMWERWDSDDRVGSGMNSYNHSPYALVSEYFYRALAGIRLDEPFATDRRVEIAPTFVSDLEWAEGSVDTPYGT